MAVVIFVMGLCCGSFVNMLVYRTEIKYKLCKSKFEGVDRNRSYCDYCGKQLSWYENVPIVSWLILKGKTKCCHKKLPVQYPLVELMTGILFVVFRNDYLGMVMVTLLMFSAVFDLKWMILPDFSTYILIGLSIVIVIMGGHGGPPLQYLLAGLGSFLFLLALHVGTKGKGMGFGDVKYAIFMGLLLGWPKIIIAYYFAFVVGAIFGISLIMLKGYKKSSHIPFGPFLITGTMFAYLVGDKLLYYVYRWF